MEKWFAKRKSWRHAPPFDMPQIAPGAQVSNNARLADDVVVSAGAIVEDECEIGEGSHIGANSIIWRGAKIGKNNRIFPFCSLGGEPQDKKFHGEESRLIIGDNNSIREYCSFNRGTEGGGGETRIGSNNWIMGYVHVAHDCIVGDNTIIANCAQFAGHVKIGDGAVIGGGSLFHQFLRIGSLAMVGGGEAVRQDVPPYSLSARGVVGVNGEGMRRAGFDAEVISRVKSAYRMMYSADMKLSEAREKIEEKAREHDCSALRTLVEFLSCDDLQLIRPSR